MVTIAAGDAVNEYVGLNLLFLTNAKIIVSDCASGILEVESVRNADKIVFWLKRHDYPNAKVTKEEEKT